MSKYTPGPWICIGMGDIVQKSTMTEDIVKDIASVYLTVGDEDEANSKLIAAAPELLEMLCIALPFVEDAELDPALKAGYAAETSKQIRALIAKATGES